MKFVTRHATATPARIALLLILVSLGCVSVGTLPPDDHVVAAPISERANIVLGNLVEAGLVGTRWNDEMSPGCATIWAVQFGLRAGQRRGREDLVRIGKLTADLEAAALRSMIWDAVKGDIDPDDPAVPGYPGLFVAAAMNGDHAKLFGLTIDTFVEKGKGMSLGDRENAGLASLLAEVFRAHPQHPEHRIVEARKFANRIAADARIAYQALAWASIARASGESGDLDEARDRVRRATPSYDTDTGEIVLPENENYPDVLSMHLAVIHAMTDLAQADPGSGTRRHAIDLLDYVFSDYYFDGNTVMHDRGFGRRAESFCSGCNFFALYLADRLYGDTLVLAPVPEPHRADAPDERWKELTKNQWRVTPDSELTVIVPFDGLRIVYRFKQVGTHSAPVIAFDFDINGDKGSSFRAPLTRGASTNIIWNGESGSRTLRLFLSMTPASTEPFAFDVKARLEELATP